MKPLSFNGANYVARVLGYHMTRGWGQGDNATQEYFRPIETFGQRLEELFKDIQAMGFEAMDMWTGHINPMWATSDHYAVARELLDQYGLSVISLAGWFGGNEDEFEKSCVMASELDCRILGGSTSFHRDANRPLCIALLEKYDLLLALENHPEKNAGELRDRIGDGQGRIGACVDTGWYGTQGYDAAQALEELGPLLMHVHLKDVKAAGAHDTCRYGEGVVPIERCVRTLQQIGYRGGISIEHEPEHFDPTEDVKASYAMLRSWIGA